MILEIKKIDVGAEGGALSTAGRSPPKQGPRTDDWEEWERLWGPRGYIRHLYGATITGGQVENSAIWPTLSKYIDLDNSIAYSPSNPEFFTQRNIDVEQWNNQRAAFSEGRFNVVLLDEGDIAEAERYLASYTGAVILRVHAAPELVLWYSDVVSISLGNNVTYLILRDRLRRKHDGELPNFPKCSWQETCEHVFRYMDRNLQDGQLQNNVAESELVEPDL